MYYLIEDNPKGLNVIETHTNLEDAKDSKRRLDYVQDKFQEKYCSYFITELIKK